MFSIPAMPRTSLSPIPPTPMQATLSLSLGAMWRRPSTCEGTIVKAAVVDATSPTKERRVIGSSLGIGSDLRSADVRELLRKPRERNALKPCEASRASSRLGPAFFARPKRPRRRARYLDVEHLVN